MGAGNVGSGVIEALAAGAERYAARVGRPLELRHVLVRDSGRTRSGIASALLTTDLDVILADPEVRIVVELMGGEEPARSYIERALASGRHVVTANKEVMAKHGGDLLQVAARHEARLLYEASVGGGIPIISPLYRDLLANQITAITAIINGTTNFMLTAMAQQGADYTDVLAEAQRLGYAEPDPAADVEGIDAAYKLAILCGLAFHVAITPQDVVRQGISGLNARDFRYAAALGYTIKLLARARLVDGEIVAAVQPVLVALSEPLAKVDGVLNAVQIEADLVGRVLLEGPGAGPAPTASAVLADVLDAARDIVAGRKPFEAVRYRQVRVRPGGEHESRYYLRLRVADRPGVLASLTAILGDLEISLASIIQFETDGDARSAELVITTHQTHGAALASAVERMTALETVIEIGNVLSMTGQG